EHLPWKQSFDLLRHLAQVRKWVLITTFGLVILAIGLGWYYWTRSTRYERIIGTVLQRECMPTPQIYKGLDAFVVSSMGDNVDHEFAQRELSPDFVRELQRMSDALSR